MWQWRQRSERAEAFGLCLQCWASVLVGGAGARECPRPLEARHGKQTDSHGALIMACRPVSDLCPPDL